jgi:hypothetical protein
MDNPIVQIRLGGDALASLGAKKSFNEFRLTKQCRLEHHITSKGGSHAGH